MSKLRKQRVPGEKVARDKEIKKIYLAWLIRNSSRFLMQNHVRIYYRRQLEKKKNLRLLFLLLIY